MGLRINQNVSAFNALADVDVGNLIELLLHALWVTAAKTDRQNAGPFALLIDVQAAL